MWCACHAKTLTLKSIPTCSSAQAAVFGSGQAAAAAVLQSIPGGHIVMPDDIYHGIRTLASTTFASWGLKRTEVDMSNLAEATAAIASAAAECRGRGPLVVWVETPSNPQTKVTDIAAVAEVTHREGGVLVVDSTWVTPWISQPIALGADIVLHSLTKYIGGHSDLTGGCLIAGERAVSKGGIFNTIRHSQWFSGAGMSPFDCWLCLRGLRSLGARMRMHCSNAEVVAAFLEKHPNVEKVHYPGLASHPGHAVAARQMKGKFGGMLSFEVAGGRQAAINVTAHLKVFRRATSLGGTESLVEHRASIEPADTPTPQTLLRLSIGLESPNDLINDLDRALGLKDEEWSAKAHL